MFTDPKQALNLEICEFLRTMSHHQDVPVSLKEFHSLEVNCGCSLNKLQKMEFLDELVRSNEKGKESKEEGRKKSRPSLLREKLCRDQLEAALKLISCGKEMDRTGECIFHIHIFIVWEYFMKDVSLMLRGLVKVKHVEAPKIL